MWPFFHRVCLLGLGGHGLYRRGMSFGILHAGRLYFRADLASRSAYVERGTQPFRPNARQTLKLYHEVPREVLEDRGDLFARARGTLAARTERP